MKTFIQTRSALKRPTRMVARKSAFSSLLRACASGLLVFFLRVIPSVAAKLIYRLKVEGAELVPATGPALLVCNHVSFVDWLIICAALRRRVRFVMDYEWFHHPLLHPFVSRLGMIPIAKAKENPSALRSALHLTRRALGNGDLVCLFPEGRLTPDGKLLPFQRGLERILADSPVPVVPMAITNMWGSLFSRERGRAFFKVPKRFRSRIALRIGVPVAPHAASALILRERVEDLHGSTLSHLLET